MKSRITLVSSMFVVMLAGLSGRAVAQDTQTDNHQISVVVPVVALLDLETSGTKNFTASFTKPANDEAGEKIVAPAANNSLWLNYTSIQAGTTTKKVNVKASTLVDGVDIHLVAGSAAGGAGTKGTPTAGFNLTTTDQTLISDIGSAYTASGPNAGHQLTYTFLADDANYANLRSGSTTVTVTYTLADN
ncbi:hypothetical protein GCM10010967_30850 [Dyadobacter beijingensis]|uniref:Uncharacterized protein n=1 Tax=Dyadobacter beijingensis TaxID=365489 RepID=A0ABQ2I2E8_9BACT|nr:hypothetical protein [Dyadobacter beijingensis]GGM95261.1 hypothetical protein GCM10010967_30850 [Dyadobacter beijingensis]